MIIKNVSFKGWKTKVIDMVFARDGDAQGMLPAIDEICRAAADAVNEGFSIIVLSDKKAGRNFVPVSSLLALGAVHQHLIIKVRCFTHPLLIHESFQSSIVGVFVH